MWVHTANIILCTQVFILKKKVPFFWYYHLVEFSMEDGEKKRVLEELVRGWLINKSDSCCWLTDFMLSLSATLFFLKVRRCYCGTTVQNCSLAGNIFWFGTRMNSKWIWIEIICFGIVFLRIVHVQWFVIHVLREFCLKIWRIVCLGRLENIFGITLRCYVTKRQIKCLVLNYLQSCQYLLTSN